MLDIMSLDSSIAYQRRTLDQQSSATYVVPACPEGSGLRPFRFDELSLGQVIGRGGSARVHLGLWRDGNVAVKMLDRGDPVLFEGKTRSPGVRILASLSHPNIISFKGVCFDPPCMMTEWCARGSLLDVLGRARRRSAVAAHLTWRLRLRMALEIAQGMLHLHEQSPPILHRDLKTANILVDSNWRCKVADFGYSRVQGEAPTSVDGTADNPRWLAPEVMEGAAHSQAADVYAFGLILYEMLIWAVPWEGMSGMQVVLALLVHRRRPDIPEDLASLPGGTLTKMPCYLRLMKHCWAESPLARPSFKTVISTLTPLLEEVGWPKEDMSTYVLTSSSQT